MILKDDTMVSFTGKGGGRKEKKNKKERACSAGLGVDKGKMGEGEKKNTEA